MVIFRIYNVDEKVIDLCEGCYFGSDKDTCIV